MINFTPPDAWILSKLQALIKTVTSSLDSCRINEGAKALEEFIINNLSQTYVPMTRDDIWDDNMETLERRHVIYAILGHTLSQIDIILHPYCPFITNYLYLLCFKNKDTVLLETWPKYNSELIDIKVEASVDRSKQIISLVNAARMKAKFKRRWPVNEVVICTKDKAFLESKQLSDLLAKQINTMSIRFKTINFSNFHEKVNSLYLGKLISVGAKPKISKIAPRLKNDLTKALQAFEKINHDDLFSELLLKGNYKLRYLSGQIDLSIDDVEFSYAGKAPYIMMESEQKDIAVFIDTTRSSELISMGLLKDIARNIQQLRKERGFVPTEILSFAHISKLDKEDLLSLEKYKNELAYYVRVKKVVITPDKVTDIEYKEIDIDGKKILISVH
jgi:isoleucyl-tRNA synthetase